MKALNLLFKREIAAPMLALGFASAMCVMLVLARIVWTGQLRYGFLIANLFLAWMPLLFALLACDKFQTKTGPRWQFFSLAGAWLLFFPNSPYIFTDIIHLTNRYYFHFWIDLILILLCALTGLVVGFVSLYLMQSVAARMFGRATGWLFVAAVTGLSSFGVYLGRFLRLNSWDVVLRPWRILHGLGAWVDGPHVNRTSFGFLVLFAAFLFLTYLMLYALTHLSPARLTGDSPPLKPA
jgi:uncharacterized membrane protein